MKVKLTDRFCTNVKSGTRMEYFDEDTTGLALRVTEQGSKSWTYNYTLGDKRVRMTLGSYPTISLAGARTKAIEARTALEAGTDPRLTAIGGETFKAVCEDYQSREGKKLRTADWRKATLDRLIYRAWHGVGQSFAFARWPLPPRAKIMKSKEVFFPRLQRAHGAGIMATHA